MTIDETIAKYKEITNADANCPAHCNISCDKCVQESGQLTEWLEELKAYKQKPEGWMWDEAERTGYNKAIDDMIKMTKSMEFRRGCIQSLLPLYEYLEIKAQQLKKGGNNGTDNQ